MATLRRLTSLARSIESESAPANRNNTAMIVDDQSTGQFRDNDAPPAAAMPWASSP